MPEKSFEIWEQLGLKDKLSMDSFETIDRPFPAGTAISKKDVLFPRIDLKKWAVEKAERDSKKGLQPDPGEHEDEISIDDFKKVELRVAKIVAVDHIPGADKLYKLSIDLGYERRGDSCRYKGILFPRGPCRQKNCGDMQLEAR